MDADTLKRRRAIYKKQIEEYKKSPAYIKQRDKGKAARQARRKNRK